MLPLNEFFIPCRGAELFVKNCRHAHKATVWQLRLCNYASLTPILYRPSLDRFVCAPPYKKLIKKVAFSFLAVNSACKNKNGFGDGISNPKYKLVNFRLQKACSWTNKRCFTYRSWKSAQSFLLGAFSKNKCRKTKAFTFRQSAPRPDWVDLDQIWQGEFPPEF